MRIYISFVSGTLPTQSMKASALDRGDALLSNSSLSSSKPDPVGFYRLHIAHVQGVNPEFAKAATLIQEGLELREKYASAQPDPAPPSFHPPDPWGDPVALKSDHILRCTRGVFNAYSPDEGSLPLATVISIEEFEADYNKLKAICHTGEVVTFAYQRLKVLEHAFEFHCLLNKHREAEASGLYDPKDFETVIKVDTHVHMAAAMTPKQLLDFMKDKILNHSDDVVSVKKGTGEEVTLGQIFKDLECGVENLTVDLLDVQATGGSVFNRFDRFNNKYNPLGVTDLRTIFMKTSNHLNGRYFAELTKAVMVDLEAQEFIATEWRMSIYGRSSSEWHELAQWFHTYRVYSDKQRWLIQIPRLYGIFKKFGQVDTFQRMLDNVFQPLFEVSIDPSSDPELDMLLRQVSGFDSVDDESKMEPAFDLAPAGPLSPNPADWDIPENPPYVYYQYFMWANITALNHLRRRKGLNTFSLRPHAGESGATDHLAATFLLASGINHGINLMKSMPLQYFYYLAQVGLAVSPLSNNALFLDYKRNPFPQMFQRGLNVSLSTDDPLQFHYTQTPLVEEYAMAGQQWGLSTTDLSEIARNSVLQSGFEPYFLRQWLGPKYTLPGHRGNDIRYTNVPTIRVAFREEMLLSEREFIRALAEGESGLLLKKATRTTSVAHALGVQYAKLNVVAVGGAELATEEELAGARLITAAQRIREAYLFRPSKLEECLDPSFFPPAPEEEDLYRFADGVFCVFKASDICWWCRSALVDADCEDCGHNFCLPCSEFYHKREEYRNHNLVTYCRKGSPKHGIQPPFSLEQFVRDFTQLCVIIDDGLAESFSARNLGMLQAQYRIHTLLNTQREEDAMRFSNKDFYRVPKVDTHIHAASAVTAADLLDFLKGKMEAEPDRVVTEDGKSLRAVLVETGVPLDNLTQDSLGVKAGDTFGRFDLFSKSYNPFGSNALREVFLKKNNAVQGEYLGELLKGYLRKLERSSAEYTELRISIYGRDYGEWEQLAKWVDRCDLNCSRNRWVIQVPRIYHTLKARKSVVSFGEMLRNIFQPLFDATLHPEAHPELHRFLTRVSGFDSVDKEALHERKLHADTPLPDTWDGPDNPPYGYYLYYMWANLHTLNRFREQKGLCTFEFRPHSGASGPAEHLAVAYMLAHKISHGLQLVNRPVLNYLYYVSQVPIALSPLAENKMYEKYERNPFHTFFTQGLQVCLSTDNPMQLHNTAEPLVEEYAIAAQMWRYTPADLAEIAINSVLHSGFPHTVKTVLLGEKYLERGVLGNDPSKSNVPNVRVAYRQAALEANISFLKECVKKAQADGGLARRGSVRSLRRTLIGSLLQSKRDRLVGSDDTYPS